MNTEQFVGTQIEIGEIISAPTWHDDTKEWRCLVAVTPRGPLVLAAVNISVRPESYK